MVKNVSEERGEEPVAGPDGIGERHLAEVQNR
jgi:hypothetical protein